MSRPPDLKRIAKEDFPADQQALVEKLAFPLNSHMEQVRNLFNKGIDFDNLTRELITLTFTTGSNSQPLNTVTFKSNLRNRVRGINIISARITSANFTYPSQAPFISFSQDGSIITILNVTGLAPETSYELLLETIS